MYYIKSYSHFYEKNALKFSFNLIISFIYCLYSNTMYYKVVDNSIIYKMLFTECKLDVIWLRYEFLSIIQSELSGTKIFHTMKL